MIANTFLDAHPFQDLLADVTVGSNEGPKPALVDKSGVVTYVDSLHARNKFQ